MSSLKLFGNDTIRRFAKRLVIRSRCPSTSNRDAALAGRWSYMFGGEGSMSLWWRNWEPTDHAIPDAAKIYDAARDGNWK